MSNALPLPFPYLPGTTEPDSFEDRVQQNFDALAIAVSGTSAVTLATTAVKTRYTGTADVGAAGNIYSVTGTFHGGPILVTHFGGEAANNFSGITQANQYQIVLDGVVQETIGNGTVANGTKARLRDVSLLLTGVAAGSHTISVHNGISDGTGAYTTVGNTYAILFAAEEFGGGVGPTGATGSTGATGATGSTGPAGVVSFSRQFLLMGA